MSDLTLFAKGMTVLLTENRFYDYFYRMRYKVNVVFLSRMVAPFCLVVSLFLILINLSLQLEDWRVGKGNKVVQQETIKNDVDLDVPTIYELFPQDESILKEVHYNLFFSVLFPSKYLFEMDSQRVLSLVLDIHIPPPQC